MLLTCTLEGLLASNRQSAIVAWHKSPTTPNVTDGIASSLKAILDKSRIERDDILYLSIGTTVRYINWCLSPYNFELRGVNNGYYIVAFLECRGGR